MASGCPCDEVIKKTVTQAILSPYRMHLSLYNCTYWGTPLVFSCGMLQQLHLPGSHNCLHITVPILPHFHLPLLIRSSRPEFPVAQYPCVSIPATIRSSHNHRSKHSATIAQYLRASIPPPIRSSYNHSNHSATIPQYPCLHTTNDQEQL